ncbi:roundabout homolog 2-like [Amphibalanus amphitrite]|uniref:roundabout homolog 2-like n=1 Tax=Amphibalanus amphitrite TaxID=1232801 RepID=UPI001C915A97|nr:roundabout homolog 2-like [Amphibalanus amphitrite]
MGRVCCAVLLAAVVGMQVLAENVEGEPGRPPHITEHPTDEMVARGQPVTLNCKAEGRPPPQVHWFKDGQQLAEVAGRFFLHGSSLYFMEVVQNRKEDDAGTYWCEATNAHGSARSRNATLDIAVLRDEFRVSPQDVQVAQTETVRLQCAPPRGHPPPDLSWRRNEEPLAVTGSRRLRLAPDGDLVISDVRHHDEGSYSCVARNVAGERHSRPARLTVHVKPFFLRPPEDITSVVSRRAELTCQVAGDPQPQIVWRRMGAELPLGRVLVTEDKSLRIDDVRLEDEGEYFCRAENAVGSVTGSARLSVTAPPVITSRATIAESDISEPVSLDCRAEGRPTPIVYWLKEGRPEPLAPGGRHTLGTNGSLVLSRPRPGDQGYYACGAVSTAGSDLLQLELLLRSQPAEMLTAEAQQARQMLERRPMSRLTARAESPTGALLVWSPAAGSPPVDGYYVRYRPVTGGPFATVTVPEPAASNHRLMGLRSHTEYQAIVSPYYRGVEGRAAPLATFSTLQDVPSGPPLQLLARVENETSVVLRWRPPAPDQTNGILTGYRVYFFSNITGLRRNYTVNSTTSLVATELTELAPHTRYWVRVAAQTAPGVGPASEPVEFTTGGPVLSNEAEQPRVVHQAWFIALLGFLVFVVVSLLVGLVYLKRQQGVKEALEATPGKSAGQEAMWVDRGWRPADSDKDSNLSEQKLLGYQQHHAAAALCAEYAELDPLRDSGPYASTCVIRQNPLSRLRQAPPGYAHSLNLPLSTGEGIPVRAGCPTMPAGRSTANDYFVAVDAKVSNRPSLADILPPPPTHPPPASERLRAPPSRGQCGAHCVECSCSDGESSYDNNPRDRGSAPRTEPCQRRRRPPAASDADIYYGIPAGGGTFAATLGAAPNGRPLRPHAGLAPVEKLA